MQQGSLACGKEEEKGCAEGDEEVKGLPLEVGGRSPKDWGEKEGKTCSRDGPLDGAFGKGFCTQFVRKVEDCMTNDLAEEADAQCREASREKVEDENGSAC